MTEEKESVFAVDGASMQKISVIVPAYNTGKYIPECLDSVIAQTFKNFEIVCIDDGSSDDSLLVFKDYANKDIRIRVISQKNTGVVAARNNAISIARGVYIFPLDSDDMIAPECLEVLYKIITNSNNVVVCPGGRYFGMENSALILPKLTKWNMYNCRNGIHNSSLYPKKFWEKYGGYDRAFDAGLEDFDFWLNFIDDKQQIIRIPDKLFYYRIKSPDESRNKKVSGELRDVIYSRMAKKHPKIAKYKLISKYTKVLRGILRLFLRWKVTKDGYSCIYIFSMPIYRRKVV